MSNSQSGLEPNANPLALELLEKTKAGKLKWEPTVDRKAFIVSIAGDTTLKLYLGWEPAYDPETGHEESASVPRLALLDPQGHELWEISSAQVKGGLWPLYQL